jgi:hypothetical protein
MKTRLLARIVVLLALLVIAVWPAWTEGSGPGEDAAGARAVPPITAPWTIEMIDSVTDVGRHVSMTFDPNTDTPYISYYDEGNADLRVAKRVGSGGNCGPYNRWQCDMIDRGGAEAREAGSVSVALDAEGAVTIAYHEQNT